MHKVCRIDLAGRDRLLARLDEFVEKLGSRFKITSVYLFGSLAAGEINEGSDIDLLIVGDFPFPFFERMQMVISLTDLPVEPWVYTMEEFEDMKKRGSPFIDEILQRGVRLV